MNKKKLPFILIPSIAIIVILFWLISPIFIVSEVNEDFPTTTTADEPELARDPGIQEVEEKPLDIWDNETIANESMPEEKEEMPIDFQGSFVDADRFHKGSGDALVIDNILRFENFQVTNGPDLRIYLATDDTASDFIDLGVLKGSKGDQNYEIPEGTDLEKYDTVLVWCRAFSVLFSTAELS